jgi:hypothetical protein
MEFFCTLLQCRVHLSMFHSSSTFGTQVSNMMCITIVQNPKVAWLENFVPWAVKVCCPCRAQLKKTFLSTSNLIISQSVRSTFLKPFVHVLLVV